MMDLNKLPKLSEEIEKLSNKSLVISNESVEEYCNSKFYLPSTDHNCNLVKNNLEKSNRSRTELIEFFTTNGRIFCDQCNLILTDHQINGNEINHKIYDKTDEIDCSNKIFIDNEDKTSNLDNSTGTVIKSNVSKQIGDQIKSSQANSKLNEIDSQDEIPVDSIGSICSLHNPPVYQQTESVDSNLSTIISVQQIHSQKSDRQILENSIVRLFIDCRLIDGELQKLHQLVQSIIDSSAGPFLFDNYSNIIVNKGMHQLKLKIIQNHLTNVDYTCLPSGEAMFKVLISIWKLYYQEIIPIIECIFYKLRDRRNITIKQISLKAFRDEIVLKLNLEDNLKHCLERKQSIPQEIKQMLLILNSILDSFPPSLNKLKLELLCPLFISPFIGFRGMYLNFQNKQPFILSNEPYLYKNKKSIDVRKTSRPIKAQPRQMDSLNELISNVIKKQTQSKS